jgi:hypothetical protein
MGDMGTERRPAGRGERIGALLVAVALLTLIFYGFWRENERRYADLRVTGCLGDAAGSALGSSQDCVGLRRLCRDAAPLVDWRHACN